MQSRDQTVIARLNSGLVIQGFTADFNPERIAFRVTSAEGGRGVEVKMKDLKALFFLKGESPAPDFRRARGWVPPPDPIRDGKKIAVTFADGETMVGYTLGYRPEKVGFWFYPGMASSPHEKIWICASAVGSVLIGAAAEKAVDSKDARREAA